MKSTAARSCSGVGAVRSRTGTLQYVEREKRAGFGELAGEIEHRRHALLTAIAASRSSSRRPIQTFGRFIPGTALPR